MGESSKRQTVLPEPLWADYPVQQKSSGKFHTGRDNATRSQALIDRSYRFGIQIKAHRNAPLPSFNCEGMLRAKPAALITSYHTRGFVEEEKNGCPIRQPFIYKSTLCGVVVK